MSNLCQNSTVARTATSKCKDWRTEKLFDASTILCSGQPPHAQNHGACLQHGNAFIKTPHSLSDVLPTAALQDPAPTLLSRGDSRGRQFPWDVTSNRLTQRVRTNSTKPASFQRSSVFCQCLTKTSSIEVEEVKNGMQERVVEGSNAWKGQEVAGARIWAGLLWALTKSRP